LKQNGIKHGNLKLKNIYVNEKLEVKVRSWGLEEIKYWENGKKYWGYYDRESKVFSKSPE
jgi:hypothetical protein